ncbi:hypothetical protein, partial [Mediterranea massiliensis]|uniref:hypothetical protein n=1 Tax=Mediterranea massiliensis TaxID=1841865 RepID=UPI00194E99BE
SYPHLDVYKRRVEVLRDERVTGAFSFLPVPLPRGRPSRAALPRLPTQCCVTSSGSASSCPHEVLPHALMKCFARTSGSTALNRNESKIVPNGLFFKFLCTFLSFFVLFIKLNFVILAQI